jgi:type I restriction enzyme M protein
MLDAETKRRIDTARDILVGKVPDPKSQVEQITIALIYKFMDDMDKEAIELGGKPGFFVGDYEHYAWSKIFDPRMGGYEMLNLYAEAIMRLNQNPNLPQLFRDIFKNAYLPYRDPETLKLFLKTIDEFTYDHSERLGDAFEYLLSVLGSQGDAGQFRTPRHIIDFMVQVVDPQKNDTILDPACGTAGFLISAYKHIVRENTSPEHRNENGNNRGDLLTTDERKRLLSNFKGYDISPDMVRLSLVNMYLHGFVQPQILEYDTLTSEERWNEYADVILANPPFMTPKGGIKPHKKFSVQSNRSEVLFVDYIAEHLLANGRAGVIVPEGIIFQSANAYKQLRKMLVENHLYAVVSLPAGVFQPYSGVKTSILLMDRQLAKKTDAILFVKIENDGYDLGAQRRPIDKNDLPDALQILREYQKALRENQTFVAEGKPCQALLVSKAKLAENGDYNLTADRYRLVERKGKQKWPMVSLGEVLNYEQPTKYIVLSEDYDDKYKIPVLTAGKTFILGYTNETENVFPNEQLPVIIFDDFTTETKFVDFPFKVKSSAMKILKAKENVNIKFVFYVIQKIKFNSFQHKRYWISEYSKLLIPLPPLDVQREIVAEIEGYQKLIDGCRQVIDAWKPDVEGYLEEELKAYVAEHLEEAETLRNGWPMVKLGEVCEITSSKRVFQEEYVSNGIPFYRTKELVELSQGKEISLELFISKDRYNEIKASYSVPQKNDILLSAVGTIGVSWIVSDDRPFYFKDGNILWIKNFKNALPSYIKSVLDENIANNLPLLINGAAYNALTIIKLKKLTIPLPPIEVQQKIVAEIEAERRVIDGCRELIKTYEEKIQRVIDEVWGE